MNISESMRASFEIIAPLVALAIQTCLHEVVEIDLRRGRLIKDIHDSLSHRLVAIEAAVEKLEKEEPGSHEWKSAQISALKYAKSAKRIINDMRIGKEIFTLESILNELKQNAWLINTIYPIKVALNIDKSVSDTTFYAWTGNEIEFSIDEALFNAVQHSNAENIEIDISMIKNVLELKIKDDGIGFDEEKIKFGAGISNLRERVEGFLGGSLYFRTVLGKGTEVVMDIPLPEASYLN